MRIYGEFSNWSVPTLLYVIFSVLKEMFLICCSLSYSPNNCEMIHVPTGVLSSENIRYYLLTLNVSAIYLFRHGIFIMWFLLYLCRLVCRFYELFVCAVYSL